MNNLLKSAKKYWNLWADWSQFQVHKIVRIFMLLTFLVGVKE